MELGVAASIRLTIAKASYKNKRDALFKEFVGNAMEGGGSLCQSNGRERQNPNKADIQRQRLVYFMRHADQRHRLRKEIFLNTLDLKERSVLNLVLNKKGERQCCSPKSSHYDRAAFQKANCSTFLENVSSLPSHSCKKSSSHSYEKSNLN